MHRSVSWSIDCIAIDWLINWWVCLLVDWLVGWFVDWEITWLSKSWYGWMNGWMDGWMDGWMNGWVDGTDRTDESISYMFMINVYTSFMFPVAANLVRSYPRLHRCNRNRYQVSTKHKNYLHIVLIPLAIHFAPASGMIIFHFFVLKLWNRSVKALLRRSKAHEKMDQLIEAHAGACMFFSPPL